MKEDRKLQALLTPAEAAKILGLKPSTLCYWRSRGGPGLPYVKSGRLVRYRPEDIEEFIRQRMMYHTHQPCGLTASRGSKHE